MQIRCIVKPKSKIDSVSVNADGSLRIKIKAQPVNGKANAYLVEYLSEVFGLPKKNIEIISGFTSSHKRLNIVAEDEGVLKNKIARFKS
ncbi:MAG: DUF167 domain-containing protein [Bacteroidetes bacterium]|nr:DUF167 domain-containing protein [Bacteroidota bacterium]